MTADHSADYLINLVRELCRLPAETEWLEFKHNNADPQEIGEYVRERFGMTQAQTPVVSRLIREAVDAGAIVPQDAEAAPKLMRYVPAWAKGTTL